MEKFWIAGYKGRRRLVKGNYSSKIQQSLNEVFVSKVLDRLGWKDHVRYEKADIYVKGGDGIQLPSVGCICDAYTSEHCEEVSLWAVLHHFRNENHVTFRNSVDALKSVGMPEEYYYSRGGGKGRPGLYVLVTEIVPLFNIAERGRQDLSR